jgi:hypothetical protein
MNRMIAAAGLVLVLGSGTALAEDVQCHRDPGPPPTIQCEDILVPGRLPDTFLLLNRSRDRYDPTALDRRLWREIPRTVRRDPF